MHCNWTDRGASDSIDRGAAVSDVGSSAEIVVWLVVIVGNPIMKFRDTVSVKVDRTRPDANLGSRMSFKGQMVAEI